jgi:hypothetical protein
LEGAAREGARAAIVPSTTTNTPVTTAVATALNAAGLNGLYGNTTVDPRYTVSVTPAVTSASGTAIEVDVYSTWGTVGLNIISSTYSPLSSAKQVKGTAVMRKEG